MLLRDYSLDMAVLKNILLNNPTQTCAVIQDDNSIKGTDLFKAVLKHDIENDAIREIHLITCDNPPENYLETFSNLKVHTYNLFQDPIGWLKKNETPCDLIINRVLTCKEKSSSVMIDSLNFLILLKNADYTWSVIHRLKRQFKKVICLFHRDEVTCNDTIKKLMFLSNVYIKLCKNHSKVVMEDKKKKLAEGIHVKPSGKIATFKEIIVVDNDCHLHSEVYHNVKQNTASCNIKDNFKNITTFRLGLDIKENEKIARDNLVLPYLRSSKGDSKEGGDEGKIVYYAESGDDMEEDPDDDLDI